MPKEEYEELLSIDEDIPETATLTDLEIFQSVCVQDQAIKVDDSDGHDCIEKTPLTNAEMRQALDILKPGSLIHRVVWPKQETFGGVYTTYMSYIKRHYGDEVTVDFDGYTESSVNTKVIERQRRRMKRTSREINFNETTVLFVPQRQFLNNLANKERFISQTC
ncbi:hypothetical protein AVEN_130543-1 [Araneus ventricosus]|uniref:Uncharacterized protein n=1 Tax=Araneus ventricosus TaxID=182803 RepID=A0A4Y2UP70_ARAVE|nr:hypothetical protein AVEN_130543-1 [Araneus ventricosus]